MLTLPLKKLLLVLLYKICLFTDTVNKKMTFRLLYHLFLQCYVSVPYSGGIKQKERISMAEASSFPESGSD